MARENIDWEILRDIDDDPNGAGSVVMFFKRFETTTVINPKVFMEINGRKPHIGSIFVAGDGSGSYNINTPRYGDVLIYNGCFQAVDDNFEIMTNLSNDYSIKKWGYKATDYYVS